MQRTSVIIIGAGPAGIAAGTKLLQHGVNDIIWLEAENRIGGRIFTTEFGANVIDLGAQWCHGEKDNVVFELANPLNLFGSCYYNFTIPRTGPQFVDSNGTLLPKDTTIFIHQIIEKFWNDTETLQNFNYSVGEYMNLNFEKALKDELINIDKTLCKQVFEWYHKVDNSLSASDSWFEVSAKGTSQYWQCEGDKTLNWKGKGYKTIFDILMKTIPDASKALLVEKHLHLNKEVVNIEWDHRNNDDVIVKCADGSVYSARHVLITTSLGVLKERIDTLFTPALPLYKQRAIRGLNFGTVDKLIFEYPHRWWPSDHKGFSFVWCDSDINKLKKFDGTEDDNRWLLDIFGFYPINDQPNILLGWICGESARKMETLPENLVKQQLIQLIEMFLDKSFNIPKPVGFLRSQWHSNPHFRGSYTYYSIITDKIQTSNAELAKPIVNSKKQQCLYFAGEATSDHHFSTVHGAIETGWREAERILHNKRFDVPIPLKRKTGVIIIGAGISGLAAAKYFLDNNYKNFLILEAQSKPGGRIETVQLSEQTHIELGAQWLHGNKNQLWKIADQYNLLSKYTSNEALGVFIRDDGVIFNDELISKVDFIVGQILEQCEMFYIEKIDKNIPKSVGEYLEQQFEIYLSNCLDDSDEIKEMKRQILNWHIRFQIIDNSCISLNQLSAKQWGSYVCTSANNAPGQAHINFQTGYTSLINILCDMLPENCLYLNTPVTTVEWCNTNTNTVRIMCENGVEYEANFVIVTVSLGVLKNVCNKLFIPELPLQMQKTIDNMGFWGINKIFLIFDHKWWSVPGYQIIWSNSDDTHFNFKDDLYWLKWISGFDELESIDQFILIGWIGGPGAKIVEEINEREIGEACVNMLRHFTKNKTIPYPIKTVRSKWLSNPFVRGAYSYSTSACDASNLGSNRLSTVLNNELNTPVLALAGEACHHSQFSTTHGAYESGLMQASAALKVLTV